MIAADTSSLVALLSGEKGKDVELLAAAAAAGELALPPVVLTEILSGADSLDAVLSNVTLLQPLDGYWERAGAIRRLLQRKNLKARIADTLIAQSCLDYDVALISRDGDFRHFAKHCGLKLA